MLSLSPLSALAGQLTIVRDYIRISFHLLFGFRALCWPPTSRNPIVGGRLLRLERTVTVVSNRLFAVGLEFQFPVDSGSRAEECRSVSTLLREVLK
jgi:hypothetical protein